MPHPRTYGTFPRKIGHYAIAEQLIPVEQRHPQRQRPAGRHPAPAGTRLPEGRLLRRRGRSFDPKTYRDRATYDKPHAYATGVVYLWVNGKLAIEKGKSTGALAGRVLRHKGPAE